MAIDDDYFFISVAARMLGMHPQTLRKYERLGLVQPKLYDSVRAGQVATGFRDITSGDNGSYHAAAGWDACTGLGVPEGAALTGVV